MIMGGGVLLAIRYGSTRFTRDIDFSTSRTAQDFDLARFESTLGESLSQTVERLGYGLNCRIQKCKIYPTKEGASFPSVEINIGYAYKHEHRAHRRLLNGMSPTIVTLDYSLNEAISDREVFELQPGGQLHAYTLVDLVAEKLRSILQQEVRNRARRQDSYDIHLLITQLSLEHNVKFKAKVLRSLREKASSRHLTITRESMSDPKIIRRSRAEYHTLAGEINGALLPFELTYESVRTFYESLPWGE